jgi:hypothetical protein
MMMILSLALAAATVEVPKGAELERQIAARDAELFRLVFEQCDPARLRTMVDPGFEMFHDKGGMVARTSEDFVADYAKSCEEKKAPNAWRSRRELVAGTMRVYPVPGYGAIEEADHVFYERQGDGPEKLVGKGRLAQVWSLSESGWRLARVLSYAHEAVEAPPPAVGGAPR